MTLEQMIQALEDGPIRYGPGPDDDDVLVPVATANEIARFLREVDACTDVERWWIQ